MISKTEKLFLFPAILLFAALYFILSYYNRLSHDDLMYLFAVKKYGLVEASIHNYQSWNTRWAGIFLANTFFSMSLFVNNLWLFHLLSLLLLVIVSAMLIRNSLNFFLQIKIENQTAFLFAFAFAMLFFANTFSIGDVWFWLNASCMFLWNVIAACLAFALIFKTLLTLTHKILLAACGLFIGGCSEPFAILLIVILSASFFIAYRIKHNKKLALALFIFLFGVLTGFILSYAGSGNNFRRDALPHTGLLFKQWIFIKVTGKFLLFHFPQKLILSFIFSFPFILFGNKFSKEKIEKLSFWRVVSTAVIAVLIAAAITFYPIVYLMSESGPERAWTGISFFMSICFAAAFFMSGYYRLVEIEPAKKLYQILVGLFIAASSVFVFNQYSTVKKYAAAYDTRNNYLLKLKGQNTSGTVALEPLPPSGLLHSSEISDDSLYFTNQQLKFFLDLPFDVVLKNN